MYCIVGLISNNHLLLIYEYVILYSLDKGNAMFYLVFIRPIISLIRPIISLIRPIISLIRPLISLIRPIISLIRPIISLIRPLISLIRPLISLIRPIISFLFYCCFTSTLFSVFNSIFILLAHSPSLDY